MADYHRRPTAATAAVKHTTPSSSTLLGRGAHRLPGGRHHVPPRAVSPPVASASSVDTDPAWLGVRVPPRWACCVHLYDVSVRDEFARTVATVYRASQSPTVGLHVVVVTVVRHDDVEVVREAFVRALREAYKTAGTAATSLLSGSRPPPPVPHVEVIACDNRGMDIGGFLVACGFLLDWEQTHPNYRFDIVLKLHSKSDARWRRQMLEGLAANVDVVLRNVLMMSETTSSSGPSSNGGAAGGGIGMVAPSPWMLVSYAQFTSSRPHLDDLCRMLLPNGHVLTDDERRTHFFVGGTAFWVRWDKGLRRLFAERAPPHLLRRLLNDATTCDAHWYRHRHNNNGAEHAARLRSAEASVRHYESPSGRAAGRLGSVLSTSERRPPWNRMFRDGMLEHGFERFFAAWIDFGCHLRVWCNDATLVSATTTTTTSATKKPTTNAVAKGEIPSAASSVVAATTSAKECTVLEGIARTTDAPNVNEGSTGCVGTEACWSCPNAARCTDPERSDEEGKETSSPLRSLAEALSDQAAALYTTTETTTTSSSSSSSSSDDHSRSGGGGGSSGALPHHSATNGNVRSGRRCSA